MGKEIQSASAGLPVRIMGLKEVPISGTALFVVSKERAEAVSELYKLTMEYNSRFGNTKLSETIVAPPPIIRKPKNNNNKKLSKYEEKEEDTTQLSKTDNLESLTTTIPVVLKADNSGSLLAIMDTLETMSSEKVIISIVHFGIGPLNMQDVAHAELENCPIYCFNAIAHRDVLQEASIKKVPVKFFNIVYDLIDEIKQLVSKAY